jgi:hypothetical protein
VAYKLLLPPSAQLHPVFHIVNLRLCKGDHHEQYLPTPFLTTETCPILHPEEVLDTRILLQHDKEVPQVMIKWSNLPVSEATWENLTEFSKTYPML